MEIISTGFDGLHIVKADLFGDERGFFMEAFNQRKLEELGISFDVKQINFAKSESNVLRGLHFQQDDSAQSKLVGCINGSVLDVAVDIRPQSETYLKHFKYKIEDQKTMLLVPRGFAHGYYTLEDDTLFYYGVDNFYSPENERGLRYNDPKLSIDWELKQIPIISEKDMTHKLI